MLIQSSRFLIIVVICNYFIVTGNLKRTIFIQFLVSHKKIRSDIIFFFLNSCAMYWSSNTILIMCNCWNWIGFKYLYISYKIYVDINISHFFFVLFKFMLDTSYALFCNASYEVASWFFLFYQPPCRALRIFLKIVFSAVSCSACLLTRVCLMHSSFTLGITFQIQVSITKLITFIISMFSLKLW